jgi:hypothetical protein
MRCMVPRLQIHTNMLSLQQCLRRLPDGKCGHDEDGDRASRAQGRDRLHERSSGALKITKTRAPHTRHLSTLPLCSVVFEGVRPDQECGSTVHVGDSAKHQVRWKDTRRRAGGSQPVGQTVYQVVSQPVSQPASQDDTHGARGQRWMEGSLAQCCCFGTPAYTCYVWLSCFAKFSKSTPSMLPLCTTGGSRFPKICYKKQRCWSGVAQGSCCSAGRSAAAPIGTGTGTEHIYVVACSHRRGVCQWQDYPALAGIAGNRMY